MSYVIRLAEANHIPAATLFHYLGKFFSSGPPNRDVLSRRVLLNDLATQRLVVAADLPAQRLQRALPELSIAPGPGPVLPNDIPALRWRQRSRATSAACPYCLARRDIHSPVLIYRPAPWELLCHRHKIWPDERQTALGALPGVIAALHDYRRLRRQHGTDHPELKNAEAIVRHWFNFGRPLYPVLQTRWEGRLRAIGSSLLAATTATSGAVILPELVAVARCLIAVRGATNLSEYDILKGVATTAGLRGPWELHPGDPLRHWARATARTDRHTSGQLQ